ncbi:MAG: aldo/keto reductase [Puniceicoccales bacterium]|jgi:diketogulonate reductase-like aldo/keto reductase|nr:aldo/keto reductase [Puniceicoccales bacterium]
MSTVPVLPLNDGLSIPQFGLGTWQSPSSKIAGAVHAALEAGYRAVDTAAIYENEAAIGDALVSSGVPRGELYLTTKLWNSEQGFDATLAAFDKSLARLRTDYLDLYLIHWPLPLRGKYVDTWKALIRLKEEGRVRSIGVSNFQTAHLKRIIAETGIVPAVNQIELHPFFPQDELRGVHARYGIVTESWSPLAQGGDLLQNETVLGIAKKHGRTAAQVILRWHIDLGLVVIPKSVTAERIRENFALFDFKLDAADLAAFATLDASRRIGPHPDELDIVVPRLYFD